MFRNATQTIAIDPDDWNDLDRWDKSGRSRKFWSDHKETLSDDLDDRKLPPEIITFIPVIGEKYKN